MESREPQDRPRAVFLISQPGSGKSRLQKEIDPELKNNGGYIDLDSDLYKPYHDNYDELMQRDDRLMTAAMRADGREWMAKARGYAIENRINVIVQDTAQDPEHSAKMMRDFRDAGYEVESVGMAVPKVISDQGIQYRYFEQVRDRGVGRLTVQTNADQSYEGVAGVSRLIDEQPGLVDRARLFRRGESVPCYDNTVKNGRWVREPPRLAATLAHEREERPWSPEMVAGFVQVQDEMKNSPTPEVETKLGPNWLTTLAALDERAAQKVTQERAQQPTATPKPTRETQTPLGSPEEIPESHQGTETEGEERTSSAIWETPKPPLKPMAAHRTEWALYDDLHGHGRRPRMLSVKTPSKAPGAYEALLHPDTVTAYERDQRQNEADGYQPGG
nr:zeta toxin family protein [Nocardiopsis sinuspersici]